MRFYRRDDILEGRTAFAHLPKSQRAHRRRDARVRGNGACPRPILASQQALQVARGLGTAEEPGRTISRRATRRLLLLRGPLRQFATVGRDSLHANALRCQLLREPVAPLASPFGVRAPHEEQAAPGAQLAAHLLPQVFGIELFRGFGRRIDGEYLQLEAAWGDPERPGVLVRARAAEVIADATQAAALGERVAARLRAGGAH